MVAADGARRRGPHAIREPRGPNRAAGGSGFVVRADEDLPGLPREAAAILDRPVACEDGCPSCVRWPDLRARLDRHRALALLRRLDVLVRREEAEPSPPWLTLGASWGRRPGVLARAPPQPWRGAPAWLAPSQERRPPRVPHRGRGGRGRRPVIRPPPGPVSRPPKARRSHDPRVRRCGPGGPRRRGSAPRRARLGQGLGRGRSGEESQPRGPPRLSGFTGAW